MPNHLTLQKILTDALDTVAPTITCRVEQAGELLFEQSFGWLDPETRSMETPSDAIYDLASLTKLFTTTACLCLVDQGKMRLDQPVTELIPPFGGERVLGGAEDPITKQPIPLDSKWRQSLPTGIVDAGTVTIRHLLTHTSGLPAWRSIYRACGRVPPQSIVMRKAELLERQQLGLAAIVAYPFTYPPGESMQYSDVGLVLLGAAVAAANGDRHIGESIAKLVVEPLELEAEFVPDEALLERVVPTEVCAWRQRRLVGEVHDENAGGLGGVAGHAGLFGTAKDLCYLGNLFLAGGGALLKRATVDEAISEQVISVEGIRRGLGWMLRSEPNPSCSHMWSKASFGHTGYTGTSLWCDPEEGLVVTLLTNRVYNGRDPKGIAFLRPLVHEVARTLMM